VAGFLGKLERKATGSGVSRAAEGLLRPVPSAAELSASSGDALAQVIAKADDFHF